jgi:ferredoxin
MNDQTKPDQKLAAELLVCDCEGTMKIDADGIASGLGCAGSATAFTQLCRRELGAFKDRLGADQPMIVACTQEAPLFSEIAAEAEHRTAPLSFVNIRESAGWSTDTASKTAKMAALIAAAAVEVTPTAVMSIKSEGQCLIYGAGQTALDAAERLASRLSVTVVLNDAGDAIPPAVVDVPLHTGRIRSARGTLGNFAVEFEAFAPAQPSSRDTLAFERPRDGFKSTCDIILDLSGRPPLFNDTVKRDGYIRVDPDNPIAIAHALFETADLFGEFEKPLYVSYDETICAHARNTRIGCRNCLDNCPTGALASNGDIIAVDAAVCGGCGNCSAVCPTGAISYDYPNRNNTIRRVQVLAETYWRAGGHKPVLLLHDEQHGRPLINMIARYGRGLPANHLPLSVYSVFQTGHDLLAAAFAAGFAHIAVLAPPDKPHDLPALETQAALIEAFVAALGIGPGRISILTECDPDIVEENLYALSPADIVEARAFAAVGGKREIARVALSALNAAAPAPQEVVALPAGAPYGRLVVDTENCTLCLSCVGACPPGALTADADHPRLLFTEQACVQCGLCVTTCPEKVIRLEPRFDFTKAVLEPTVIKEEEPFNCISCGKPFGTKSSIERIVAKLEGRHSMFQGKAQTDLIRMCDNCRVITLAERGGDPMAMGERPRVRTTEDYIIGTAGDDDDTA